MIRSTEYQIKHALSIADNNPDVFVGFFCKREIIREFMAQNPAEHGVFESQWVRYISKSGGKVQFFDVNTENAWNIIPIYQLSHAFITENTPPEIWGQIKTRLRYPLNKVKELSEPMGLYFPWGVERMLDY